MAGHGTSTQHMFGYLYNVDEVTISLVDCNLDANANKKLKVCAEISKVFDPISLFLPMSVKGHLLIREFWCKKSMWDDMIV